MDAGEIYAQAEHDERHAKFKRLAELEAATPPEKMFPLQASKGRLGPLSIPWSVAEKAYGVYAGMYGKGQSLERLAERGGFGTCEMDDLYPQWREEVSVIAELKEQYDRLLTENRRLVAELESQTKRADGLMASR